MRSRFDADLVRLNAMLIQMGARVERAIEDACKSLVERDAHLARETYENDADVNRMERDIEALCLRLLLQQQPVARDLRMISAAMKLITDMERIGEQAQDIAEIVMYIASTPHIKEPEHISAMSAATISMVHQSIDAFVSRDLDLARAVIESDDLVDDLFRTVKHELCELITGDATLAEPALDLLMIAKYFERIGDHATNIAEWVEFSITGQCKGETL